MTEEGLSLTRRVVKREFRRLLAKARFRPVRLYDLRHTAATLGIAASVSIKVISDLLGHASISFTLERYSRVLLSTENEAAARVEKSWLRKSLLTWREYPLIDEGRMPPARSRGRFEV